MRSVGRVCIVGAGIGGLAAAMVLAGRGLDVVVLERASQAGGKALLVPEASGVTLRPVFEALFDAAGQSLPAWQRRSVLSRFAWAGGAGLELADGVTLNADAVGRFAGSAAARGYRDYAARGQRYYEALEKPFITAQRPGRLEFAANVGLARQLGLGALKPLWEALGEHFADPRLRQVFGRAACYVGASPLLAPATLVMIGHVEQLGVWRVPGGLAAAMRQAAVEAGADLRTGCEAAGLDVRSGVVRGVLTPGGAVPADAVIGNVDVAGIVAGALGPEAAATVPEQPAGKRSFSALGWRMAEPVEIPTTLLPDDPTAEFTALQYRGRLAEQPSVQLSGDSAMVMAPARADTRPVSAEAVSRAGDAARGLAARAGMALEFSALAFSPDDAARAAPGTGGALYGQAMHGWGAAFARPAARTRLPGFFLCGGGTHPGAGLAMAAISGRLAAEAVLEYRL